ncbi:MAG: Na+/H+ antiporter subunit D [Chloroflexales bacterium]|nr:Na+/H+ antiporter subunit D [Chloroflexales bacterium]
MVLPLLLPLLIPLTTAVVCLLAHGRPRLQRPLGVAGAAALLAAGLALLARVWADGLLVTQPGGWPAPFGITLAADLLSALLVALTGVVGLAVAVYSAATIDAGRARFGYYPLLHVLLFGVCGAFLTGDLFNLYVWFEVLLIASFVLLALGGERPQLEGAIKYVTLNLVASTFFLVAVGLLYAEVGTLNMADLARRVPAHPQPALMTTLAMLFLAAFGIKAAAFPLFFWLPAAYHTPPPAVSALFAGLLSKVGVYALIRTFTLIFRQDPALTQTLLLSIAALTMVTGVLGAVAQGELRRILAFESISQVGYMLLGLGLLSRLGLAAAIFFMLHHGVVKTGLFLVSGLAERRQGTGELRALGGLYRAAPLLAALYLVAALAMAGLPPLSGFAAKLALVQAGLGAGQGLLVAVALLVSVVTLYVLMRVWSEAFWRPAPAGFPLPAPGSRASPTPALAAAAALAVLAVLLGVGAEPVLDVTLRAADALLQPEAYIAAVLRR